MRWFARVERERGRQVEGRRDLLLQLVDLPLGQRYDVWAGDVPLGRWLRVRGRWPNLASPALAATAAARNDQPAAFESGKSITLAAMCTAVLDQDTHVG